MSFLNKSTVWVYLRVLLVWYIRDLTVTITIAVRCPFFFAESERFTAVMSFSERKYVYTSSEQTYFRYIQNFRIHHVFSELDHVRLLLRVFLVFVTASFAITMVLMSESMFAIFQYVQLD